MFRHLVFSAIALLAASSMASAAGQDDVKAAAKKLADANGYSWKTTSEGGGGGGGGGSTQGKTEKDGFTWISIEGQQGTREIVIKGDKVVVKTDDGWKTAEELAADGGNGQPNPARFLGRFRNFKAPAAQLEDIADKTKDLKQSADAYEGDLTEEGAKSLLTFGGRGRGGNANAGNGPQISDAKGSLKVWVKDGAISKYEVHVQGSITGRNGNARDVDRTTTTEISDVGSTKVDVPEDAKKKLS